MLPVRARRLLWSLVPVALAMLPAGGCRTPGESGGGGPSPTLCPASPFPDGGAGGPATLTLVVGSEDAAHTRIGAAWTDGEAVPLVAGGQGGYMIRPALDVTAPAPLTETEDSVHATCLGVRMIAGAPASAPPVVTGILAPRIAGTTATYHVAPLFGLLTFSRAIDGASVPVAFDVHTAAGDGHAQLIVVPDSRLPF